MSVLIP